MSPTPLDHLNDDDRPVGRLLSRREVLALMGATGSTLLVAAYAPGAMAQGPSPAAAASAATIPACVISPELTEGPYFADGQLERSDIRSDPVTGVLREGLPLQLRFAISALDGSSCRPLAGAVVDVWHCDAAGEYSAVRDRGFDTTDERWLRGFQRTDATGSATFQTIYPGWYSGRAVHIHFKVRTDPEADSGLEFTSQLFFDDDVSRTVFEQPPYADKGPQDTPNADDGIFQGGGDVMTLALEPLTDGFSAVMPIGVVVTA